MTAATPPPSMPRPLLQVQDLRAGYGKSQVLHGVGFDVRAGEILALLGRNGAGRSTCAKAIMGLVAAQGAVHWRGQPILGRAPWQIARLGLGYVPEDRAVFPRLTVHQNLRLGLKTPPGRWREDDMYALFPALKARQHTGAGLLSGGEQQMLTLCRTLMGDPALVLIDEPTEGLAPRLAVQVGHCLRALRGQGVAVLLIEQKLGIALDIADRVLVMGQGRIVFEGTPAALRANAAVQREWLAV